jgi:D-xylulose reductase
MVLGHESVGTVVETGDAVTGFQKGDRVALEPGVPCRYCARCKEGRYNLCANIIFAATPPVDGTLARYYALPRDFCYKLPDHVSTAEGAMLEPLAVAVHTISQARLRQGDTVVVMGAGPIGLLCMSIARAFGAGRIVAVDINPSRLDFAKGYAADACFTPSAAASSAENAQRLKEENGLGPGADVAIEASGSEACV